MLRDSLYRHTAPSPGSFCFDDKVARVFADMIRRSVPGYALTLDMISVIAAKHIHQGSHVYDLGCSLGAATAAILRHPVPKGCRVFAVDNSLPMLAHARKLLAQAVPEKQPDLICADIRDVHIHKASMVVLNFTLQFIPKHQRRALLSRIHAGLLPGGALILSEKIRFEDPNEQARQSALHETFKRLQGYSDLEISRKRQALEQVLCPETPATHKRRLRRTGFTHVYTWFRCFNFVSMLAIK